MRVTVFGAGAIGGLLAHALHDGGATVSLIARGAHLDAIRAHGLTLEKDGAARTIRLPASDRAEDLGPQDYVVIALKAQAVPPVVGRILPLLGPQTAVVPAVNGLPWWYFHAARTGTPLDDRPVETVDPGGAQWQGLTPRRAIGCVVYPACEILRPGTVRHIGGDRVTLGEPDGTMSERAVTLSKALIRGGLRAPVKSRLRDEIWVKLLGNATFNPISALTGASLDLLGGDAACRAVIRDAMMEVRAVGEALGAHFAVGIEKRIDGGAGIAGHKPSTRHDVEAGRPLELDALVSAVQELARGLTLPTPVLDTVAALARMQGQVLGLYDRRAAVEGVVAGTYRPAP
jgi:2-dehydropantoate 2-reductase